MIQFNLKTTFSVDISGKIWYTMGKTAEYCRFYGANYQTGGYKTSLRKISQLRILCILPRILCSFSQLKTFMFKIAKGYDSISKTIRIPEPVLKRLETLAMENNISLNQLINQCIRFALENLYIEHADRE